MTKGKTWYFIYDEDRYGDKLLHCTIDVKQAKRFATVKESRFYDPKKIPNMNSTKKCNCRGHPQPFPTCKFKRNEKFIAT
jgi:hypothetical protein